jgi:uncharacterized membrane protein
MAGYPYLVALSGLIALVLMIYVFHRFKIGETLDVTAFPKSSHKLRSLTKISYKASLIFLALLVSTGFIMIFLGGYLYSVANILLYTLIILSIATALSMSMFISLLFIDAFYMYFDMMRRIKDRSLRIKITLLTTILVIFLIFLGYNIYPFLGEIARHITETLFKTTAVP